ncbi:hypothetical protein MKW98_020362, partial [Papaver atlanticum]
KVSFNNNGDSSRSICFWKPKINFKEEQNQSHSKGIEEGKVSIEDGKQCNNETNKEAAIP